MNKKVIFSVLIVLLIIISLGCFFVPKYYEQQEQKTIKNIKDLNSAYTNKILEEFNQNPSNKTSMVCQKVSDELNKVSKNPYNKKELAFTFETNCKGCINIGYDDSLSMVIVTTLDKQGSLVSRTVIKPPSFVTYTKEEDEKGEK